MKILLVLVVISVIALTNAIDKNRDLNLEPRTPVTHNRKNHDYNRFKNIQLKTKRNGPKPKALEDSSWLVEVDHFRPQDNRTVRFPYYQNVEHFEIGGPLYIFVSSGGFTNELQWLESGLMYDIAAETNGALIYADLRYFNDNRPTDYVFFSDLQYLTVEQILVDIAFLAETAINNLNSYGSNVILWGSGLGGSLAVFARQKYPNLIHAAWSSSGIFQPESFSNVPYEYLSEIIAEYGGQECADNVAFAFHYMEQLIVTYDYQLAIDLNMCYSLRSLSEERAFFFEEQIKYITDYLNVYHYDGLQDLCQTLSAGPNPYLAWAEWSTSIAGPDCRDFGYYEWFYFMLNNFYWDTDATDTGLRQWYYLVCTQLGLHRTSAYGPTLFTPHIPQYFHAHKCDEVFWYEGFNYTQIYDATEQLIIQYGGSRPSVTNVIYTNGILDHWYPQGIHEIDDENAYAFNIPNVAQSADLSSIQAGDSEELLDVKERIVEIITEWAQN